MKIKKNKPKLMPLYSAQMISTFGILMIYLITEIKGGHFSIPILVFFTIVYFISSFYNLAIEIIRNLEVLK